MRTTLLGSLLDSLRAQPSRGFEDVRLFEYGAVYLPRGDGPAPQLPTGNPWYPRADPELPVERTHLGALMTGRVRPASWGDAEPPRADFFAAKAVLEALMRALRDRVARGGGVRPARSCTRAAARRCSPATRRPAGSASCTRRSRRQWDLDGVGRLRARLRRARRRAASCVPRYEDLTSFPADPPGPRRRRRPTACPAARVLDVIRGAGGALLRDAEVFDVYRGAQVGEGRASLADPARVPRRRPHAHRRGGRAAAREDRRRAARPGRGRAACLAVAVLGASGYAGAIAAMLVHRHPFFELAHVTARSEAGARLDDIHPRTRVPLELEPWDAGRAVRRRRGARLLAAPRRRAGRRRAARARRAGRRPLGRLPAARPRHLRGLVRRARRARRCSAQGVYGLPELHRDAIAGADLVANPGCYPTAALLALAPLARAGLIGDVVIDAKSGVSGAGREPTAATHFVSADENMTPYKVDRHRHTPEIEQELAGQGAPVTITFTPHLVPLAQGELVSCYVTPARERRPRTRCSTSTTTRTRASRGSSCGTARPACSRCATPTTAASRCTPTRAPGRDPRVRDDRQPVEGRRVAGRAEPEPDVRPRRARGAA